MWLMGEKRNANRVWWVNLKKRDNLQHLDVDGSIILTLLRPDGLLIKYPAVPGRFKHFECSNPQHILTYILTL